LNSGGSQDAITPQRVASVLWRRKLVCSIVAAAVILGGAGYVLARPKAYQSTASVALLPVSTNAGILPNYPNLLASLIPTYVQLVSSPALLNRVAATLPFTVSAAQLANEVHAESLSNAAVINIVAQTGNAARSQQIAARTMAVFLDDLQGNGVVIPSVYGQPVVPVKTAPPSVKLLLGAIVALAIVLGLGAGLLWDRLSGKPDGARKLAGQARPPVLGVMPRLAEQRDASTILAAEYGSVLRRKRDSLRTNFMYSTAGRKVRSVTVTSLRPGEGKTTVAVHLAVSLAELGMSVVLVDGAVNDPALHEVFGIENGKGLTSTVLSDADPASLPTAIPSVKGLQVVTSGPRLPKRGQARHCWERLPEFFSLADLVIVDGPALQGGTAADTLTRTTDAVLLVVSSDGAWPEAVVSDLRMLGKHKTTVLGTVLTDADSAVRADGQEDDEPTGPIPGPKSSASWSQ